MNVDIEIAEIERLEPFTILDIRMEHEVMAEPLPCEHIHIPMDRLMHHPKVLDRDRVYVLVCSAGIRTLFAAAELRKIGYQNVYSLKGGLPSLKQQHPPE